MSPPSQGPLPYPVSKALARVRRYVGHPRAHPHPESRWDAFLFGLAQPIAGLRTLRRDRDLLNHAFFPTACLIGLALVVSLSELDSGGWPKVLRTFYLTIIALAPVPPVIFGRHYARLASSARNRAGLGPVQPCLRSIWQLIWEAVAQLLIIAIALAPLTLLVRSLPLAGAPLAASLGLAWALHWVVVEAYDSARTLPPDLSLEELEALSEARGAPWFVRLYTLDAKGVPGFIRAPAGWFRNLSHGLGHHWLNELYLMEQHPWATLGFALSTGAILAVPALNLFFRPAVVIGAAYTLAHLERESPLPELPVQGQPVDSVQDEEAPREDTPEPSSPPHA